MGRRRTNSPLLFAASIGRQAIVGRAVRRGVLWRTLFYIGTARTVLRMLAGSNEEVVLSERLRPGQPVQITAIGATTRKRDRAAARAAGMSRRRARKL